MLLKKTFQQLIGISKLLIFNKKLYYLNVLICVGWKKFFFTEKLICKNTLKSRTEYDYLKNNYATNFSNFTFQLEDF